MTRTLNEPDLRGANLQYADLRYVRGCNRCDRLVAGHKSPWQVVIRGDVRVMPKGYESINKLDKTS